MNANYIVLVIYQYTYTFLHFKFDGLDRVHIANIKQNKLN